MNMSKQTKYWIIGILAAILVFIIWSMAQNRSTLDRVPRDTELSSEAQTQQTTDIHEGMDHGSSSRDDGMDSNLSGYLDDQDTIMMDMMTAMQQIPVSGSAAIDFLNGMIPHHESAIEMAESYLNHGGSHPQLKTLAENIVKVQEEEITQMNSLVKEIEESGEKDAQNEDAYLAQYHKMFEDSMSHHVDTTHVKNLDQAFAEGMMMHHQMAVDMSSDILDYTDQEKVKELAQTIIDAQEEEIAQMQEILKQINAS